MGWARILVYVTGMVDQELLAQNEYLAAENRIVKAKLQGRLKRAGQTADHARGRAVDRSHGQGEP
ncbi:MAG: hypothetical protein P8Y71_26765 [Pseudolabrys sp.]